MNKLILITILMMSLAINAQDTATPSAVSTKVADVVTSTSATLYSKIILNNGETITEKGFVYSLSAKGLIIGGSNVDKAVSDREIIHRGTDFSSKNIEGLTANKQYFYKAYATNSKGTSYGDIQSFTTESTETCEHPWGRPIFSKHIPTTAFGIVTIDGNNATADDVVGFFIGDQLRGIGTIVLNEGISYMANSKIQSRDVDSPEIEDVTFKVWDYSECKAVPVAFTTRTNPGNNIGAGWEDGVEYLPLAAVNPVIITAPAVSTNSESDLTSDSATLNGNITSNGGETIMERGFVYSTSNTNPIINGANVSREIVSGVGTGGFSINITGLTENTLYYYKAYATNTAGTSYGVVVNFTTPVIVTAPTVSTASVNDLMSTSATLGGNMASNGGETIMERGFVYSTSNTNPIINGANVSKEIVSGVGTGGFSISITSLTENTEYYYKAYATNTAGTSYGVVVNFTTPATVTAPTVSTASVNDLMSTSATLGGSMTSNGGEAITERGFVYSTSNTDPEINGANVSKEIVSGTGTGGFSISITSLTENTEYYYKAYATNTAGTSYGVVVNFTTPATVTAPTVSTASVNDLMSTSATLNGNMTSNGGEAITERGFVYSTSNTDPEINGANVSKEIVSGTGTGGFSISITSLTENTEYYYKAYATNTAGTSYGVVVNFTTPATVTAPTVNTTSESDLTSTSATLNGNMTSNGGEAITERGFVYSTSNTDPEINGANVSKEIVSGVGTGGFSINITNLDANTLYYYKAYATNTAGTSYGVVVNFTTPVIVTAPTVSTTSVNDLMPTSATLGGSMTSNGGETIMERGFVYSTSNTNPIINGANVSREIVSGVGTGDFSINITGLTENTLYYYKAYATNTAGTSYGVVVNFTTPVIVTAPTVSTASVNDLMSTSATLNGNMTSNGGEAITERGFVYSTSNTDPEINGANVSKEIVSGTGTGGFSISITSLTENTEYYYKAYATNTAGTSYGVVVNFTTPATVTAPTVNTTSESDLTSTSATLNGNMTSNGGEAITERGFVYSTSNTDLTIAGATNVNVSGTGTGVFSEGITGLTENTLYYYKAYATNTAGTTYGNEQNFTTSTLGNEDFEIKGFSISPNPTDGILNITVVEKAEYRLLNIRGQTLKTGVLAKGKSNISLSSFAKGIYLLNVKTSKGSFTGKIVRK